MQQTLRQRLEGLPTPFYALMLSDVLSGLAMGAGYVAISWWVVQSGGARDMAWFGSITALVMLLSLPLTAPLGDRLPKNRLIGGGMLLAMLSALLLALMAAMGWYRIGWVIAVESLAMLAWSIVLPSMLSIAAEMVPAARLGDALSLQKSSQSAGNLIGPVLGGGLMAATSPTLTLLAYACLLVVAAAASLYVRVPPRAADAVRQPWLEDIRSGLYARWRIPLERYWTLAVFVILVAFMPLVTTLLPVKLHALGLSAAWLGGCEAAISAGMLLGSLWFTHVLLRRFSRYQARTIVHGGLRRIDAGSGDQRQPLGDPDLFRGDGADVRAEPADRPNSPHAGGAGELPRALFRHQCDAGEDRLDAGAGAGRSAAACATAGPGLSDLRVAAFGHRAAHAAVAGLEGFPGAGPRGGEGLVLAASPGGVPRFGGRVSRRQAGL